MHRCVPANGSPSWAVFSAGWAPVFSALQSLSRAGRSRNHDPWARCDPPKSGRPQCGLHGSAHCSFSTRLRDRRIFCPSLRRRCRREQAREACRRSTKSLSDTLTPGDSVQMQSRRLASVESTFIRQHIQLFTSSSSLSTRAIWGRSSHLRCPNFPPAQVKAAGLAGTED